MVLNHSSSIFYSKNTGFTSYNIYDIMVLDAENK